MSLNQQYFTNAGIDFLGRANAGQLLTITKIVVGAGTALSPNDIYPLVDLISRKADVPITRKKDLGNGKMIVSGVLNEAILPAGPPFSLRELGVMAMIGTGGGTTKSVADHLPSDPGGSGIGQAPGLSKPIVQPPAPVPLADAPGEKLYCASNVFADAPDTVTPGGTSTHAFDITIVIDRAENVTVIIGDSSVVDCQNIPPEDVGPGVYAKREGNIFDFKKLVEGQGIQLDDESFDDRIIVSIRTLDRNLDLYVPASYANPPPDTKPEQFFPDIQAAHDYLLQFVIPTDKFATIWVDKAPNLATGFVYTKSINFSHPNSKQISLIGRPRVNKPGNSCVSVTPGLVKQVTGLANTTDLVVGQRVYVAGIAPPWDGGCFVTAKGTTTVNLSIEKRDTQPNYVTPWNAATMLSYYPTVLVHNGTDPIFINCPYGIGIIRNLCVDSKQVSAGADGAYCIAIESGSIQDCMVMRARRGITGGPGMVGLWGEIVVTQCDFGIISSGPLSGYEAPGPPLIAFAAYINGCSGGIFPAPSGCAIGTQIGNMDHTLVVLSHNLWGVECAGGNFRGGTVYFQWNDIGFRVTAHGVVTMNPANYTSYPGGNGLDIYAQGLSYVEYARHGGALPTCSPDPDTFDVTAPTNFNNQMAFIHLT